MDGAATTRSRTASYALRAASMVIGIIIMALGSAVSIKANLGVSPISSPAYVASLFTPLTVGQTTIIINIVFLLIQIVLLRRDFKWIQVFQVAVAVTFGMMIDVFLGALTWLEPKSYLMQWVVCVASCPIMAFGIFLEIKGGMLVLGGEGVTAAMAKVLHMPFGTAKTVFDVAMCVLAVAMSLIFMGELFGVREGTVFLAIFTGIIIRLISTIAGRVSRKGK